jgi:hypothetical protein
MKPRKDSADKGAGSGCMARLVRCSLFFFGRVLPVSGRWPVAAIKMKKFKSQGMEIDVTERCGLSSLSSYPDKTVFYRASSTNLEQPLESGHLIGGERIVSPIDIEDPLNHRCKQSVVSGPYS